MKTNRPDPVAGALRIGEGTDDEREWAAMVMASSEPWLTFGRDRESCRAQCRRPDLRFYVARRGDAPCGFVLLHPRGVAGSPYIVSIAAAEEARGQGIGASLLAFVERELRGAARHVFLCVSSFNPRARAFYEREGYRAVGELQDYLIDGASEILMHKRLDR